MATELQPMSSASNSPKNNKVDSLEGKLERLPSYSLPKPKLNSEDFDHKGKPQMFANGLRKSSTSRRAMSMKLVNRVVHFNDPEKNAGAKFADNVIKTSKYNVVTFIPVNLFEQFRRIANFYFLIVILVQIPDGISPFPISSSIFPLAFIIFVTMAKEAFEDYKRHKEDNNANNREYLRLDKQREVWEKVKSKDLRVGDILKLVRNDDFPADVVVLFSSKVDNTCYISTADLDGEVTPKVRAAVNVLETQNDIDFVRLRGSLTTIPPNKSLYGFEGTLESFDMDRELGKKPLGDENVSYRGSKLINTDYICALAFATGRETKLMLNRSPRLYKFTEFEKLLNRCVLCSLALQVCVNLIMAICSLTITEWSSLLFSSQAYTFGYNFVSAFILFSYMIPISLYVSMEFVKLGQAKIMELDNHLKITTELQTGDKITQTMKVKSSNQVDDLGMIEYVFTDKTGTLTRNQMELSQCSVDGQVVYNDLIPAFQEFSNESARGLVQAIFSGTPKPSNTKSYNGIDDEIARQFFFNPMVNNSLIPKLKGGEGDDKEDADSLNTVDPVKMGYLGESPDEVSLAEAMRSSGLFLQSRINDVIRIRTLPKNGVEPRIYDFKVFGMLKFSSDRKRMDVVALCPDGVYRLYVKGADLKILPMLDDSTDHAKQRKQKAISQLSEFADKGSRTLVMGCRVLDEKEFSRWKKNYDEASTSLENREKKIEASFAEIERNVTLLGCTAVDDQLQNGVPVAVESLVDANIVVMMLTGDKQETAVSIGKASRIIRPGTKLLYVNADNAQNVELVLDEIIQDYKIGTPDFNDNEYLAMVVDGFSMEVGITKVYEKFMKVFLVCSTIVCNRATPSQKALVVDIVKNKMKKMCLAIGDGANDVSMIQTAQVGVGIQGKEGAQAALTADFVLHRFRHLTRLIFVHGRYSYLRSTRVVTFQFYKNTFFPMLMFWYSIFSGFTSQPAYDSYILTLFNVFFSGLYPITVGWIEKDIKEVTALLHPQAFALFRMNYKFDLKKYFLWVVLGFYHSVVTYFFAHGVYIQDVLTKDGKVCGLYSFGNYTVSAAIIIINCVFLMYTFVWNWVSIGSMIVGILAYFLTFIVFANWDYMSPDLYGTESYYFGSAHVYFYTILVCFLCFAPGRIWNYWRRYYQTQYVHLLQEECDVKHTPARQASLSYTIWDIKHDHADHTAHVHTPDIKFFSLNLRSAKGAGERAQI